ncbi:MAG: CoA-binding protein [Balneolaceae bacterium]|nr:CoA-binding protein [Balneolaceae bacterium]
MKKLLESAKTIAVVGCSNNKMRTSYHIAKYIQEQGYRVIPVHPEYDEVLGEKVYPTVYDIPDDINIDIVDIFRNPEFTANMVDDIIKRVEQTGRKPVVWTQLGVSSEEAKKKAENAGLKYVEEKCLMVEHQRLLG